MRPTLTEIKVNDEGDAGPRHEERREKPPYFWWELEDERIDVRNVMEIDASRVNQSRLDEHRRNKGPESLSATSLKLRRVYSRLTYSQEVHSRTYPWLLHHSRMQPLDATGEVVSF